MNLKKLIERTSGFLFSGFSAFATDVLILHILTEGYIATLPVLFARLISITIAMVVGWLLHRTLTFGIRTLPNLTEFLRYAAIAWFAVFVNYVAFALIVKIVPNITATIAIAISSLLAMFVSFIGMHLGVFKHAR